jgi:hypothetical protein
VLPLLPGTLLEIQGSQQPHHQPWARTLSIGCPHLNAAAAAAAAAVAAATAAGAAAYLS